MDVPLSAGPIWRSAVLLATGLTLAACAAELAEIAPTPATPVAEASAPPVEAAVPAPAPPVVVTEVPAPAPPPPIEVAAAAPADAATTPSRAPADATATTASAPADAATTSSPAPADAATTSSPAPATPAAPVAPPPAPEVAPVPAATPSPGPPGAPVEVTGLEISDVPAGGLLVRIQASGPLEGYESFTLPDPPRLVVDIPNATHAIGQPVPARPPLVTAIRSSQYRERPVKIVRVVFDLRAVVPYQVVSAGQQLKVELGTAAAQAAGGTSPAAPAAAAAPAVKPAARVTRVDVQQVRGRQRIVIGTSGTVTYQVQEAAGGLGLSVDVLGALIEPSASRTLDLRQVASPLQRVRAEQLTSDPDRVVRVAADLKTAIRYEVQQTSSAIVVELSPVASSPPPAAPAPPAKVASPPVPAPPAGSAASPAVAGGAIGGTKGAVTAPIPLPAPAMAPPPPPLAVPAPPGAGLNRLSMDFKEADINNLLRIIAEVSGMNVVAGDDVRGKVTVRLVNVDWQQALDVILRINGMGYEIDGNILRVASLGKLENERKARDDAKKREEDARVAAARAKETEKKVQVQLEPLQMEVIPVNYAKADEIAKQLDRLKTKDRPDVSLVVDPRTNKLIIQETAARLEEMRKLLKELDRQTPQVLIEARIVEANRSFAQSLGVEWGFSARVNAANLQAQPASVFSDFPGSSSTLSAPVLNSVPLAIAFPALTNPVGIGLIASGLFSDKLGLAARISAGERERKIKTLSAPKIATLDNQEAEIKHGTQVPYTTIDSSGRTVIAFQDAFIRLKVTPHITNDRRVSMRVEAERSFPDAPVTFSGGFVYPINTRKAMTNVILSNGSTIVIGGLMKADDNFSEPRVPWLGKIPALSWLFKSTTTSDDKEEMLIFLTPTILEEPVMPQS